MKAVISATVTIWLLAAPVSAQHWHDEREHWQKYDKDLDDDRDHEFDSHLQGCFLQPVDVHIVSAYFAPRSRELPAGQRKKYYRSSHLPRGWEKKIEPLPGAVEGQLMAIPREYRRGIIDGSVVLYEPKTGAILDSVILFAPQ
jgi:hypothetical protein